MQFSHVRGSAHRPAKLLQGLSVDKLPNDQHGLVAADRAQAVLQNTFRQQLGYAADI